MFKLFPNISMSSYIFIKNDSIKYLLDRGFTRVRAIEMMKNIKDIIIIKTESAITIQKIWRSYYSRKLTRGAIIIFNYISKCEKSIKTIQYYYRVHLYRRYCKGNLKNIWVLKKK